MAQGYLQPSKNLLTILSIDKLYEQEFMAEIYQYGKEI